jgi:hypothetical protein
VELGVGYCPALGVVIGIVATPVEGGGARIKVEPTRCSVHAVGLEAGLEGQTPGIVLVCQFILRLRGQQAFYDWPTGCKGML